MDLQLKGKRAPVTGSTSGIGWATARELAAEGACVILNGRDPARLASAVARIRAEVPDAAIDGVQADLSSAAGCQRLLGVAGEVDILINNLGIFEPKPFEQIVDDDWLRFFEVNVMSGVHLARHHVSRMKERGWGRIVFISSESGICPPADMVHYGMTKSAQLSVSRGLAETCVGTGVTVMPSCRVPPASRAWASSSPSWRLTRARRCKRPSMSSSNTPVRPRCCSALSTLPKSPPW